ncbi:4-hydroxy-tetrahydrodipicolinate reductase [Candidatus Enterococcus ferrettii]|uniref:4-hydroxy-tetrahydrodipicolinate reductase n=1 Tax=Candidatus Enterococcus ferrettii TaxID=2815324 RepID=A0ABV0ENC3_9ENTE|nr:4-hydroxy-tetrahydrodipicolinate reductase [Enterococcus sp. 665A]MBO1339115.1 4-hydroxy-tetrahydrodipicolinate reductase [Enterococcus sp. 665A]
MNVIVIGPKGKMGRLITQIAAEREDMKLVGGVGPAGREYIGQDLGSVAGVGYPLNVSVVDQLEEIIDTCDVLIDFSTKEMALEVLQKAVDHKKAFVCGTTGFSPEEMQKFQEASQQIPVLYAANTSKLVNVMNRLLEIAAVAIGNETDIEIIEMHDRWKKDAPSGTSKEMGEVLAEAMGRELADVAVFGREGESLREENTIGYHSLRMGDTPSSHIVTFGGFGERLEISHHSYNFQCFASGACDCAAFLADQAPGYYTVKDAIKF